MSKLREHLQNQLINEQTSGKLYQDKKVKTQKY